MILDGAAHQLTYWPVPGLVEGHTSAVIQFTVVDVNSSASIKATSNPHVKVWVRLHGVGSYQDITATPFPCTGLSGNQSFDIYVEALTPITEFERVPLSVFVALTTPAGWTT